jgi:hypothetical protein
MGRCGVMSRLAVQAAREEGQKTAVLVIGLLQGSGLGLIEGRQWSAHHTLRHSFTIHS